MNRQTILILAAALGLCSCEKVKQMAENAKTAVNQELQTQTTAATAQAAIDPALQQLVDQNEEGVIFRKDLPFPQQVTVKSTLKREISGRFFHTSELGKRVENIKGTELTVCEMERAGSTVRYTLKETSFIVPAAEKDKDGKLVDKKVAHPLRPQVPSMKPVQFRQDGGTWKADGANDFRLVVLSRQLSPVFEQLMIDQSLAPRPLWFAKKRLKIGDEMSIGGASMPMLVAGGAQGSMKLKLEAIEPVAGHPCGVVSVSGTFSRQGFPDFEGRVQDEDVTIENGKLWLSLIYPVIIKEEFETIQTFKPAAEGGIVGRGQGTIKHSLQREWKPMLPGMGPVRGDQSSVSLNMRTN